jgi:predicted transcriptional regulator
MKTIIVVDDNSYTSAHFISLHNPTYTADYLYNYMKKYDILSENQRLSVKSKTMDLLIRLKQEISDAIDIIINKNVLSNNNYNEKYDIFDNS